MRTNARPHYTRNYEGQATAMPTDLSAIASATEKPFGRRQSHGPQPDFTDNGYFLAIFLRSFSIREEEGSIFFISTTMRVACSLFLFLK